MEQTSLIQKILRVLIGSFLVMAGVSHLTWARTDFQAQVPVWVPLDPDTTVILSGIAEILLGLSLLFLKRKRSLAGIIAAVFFLAVFPGNWAQYIHHRDAFGLDTDSKRLTRLFFQPVLMAWALWSTGSWMLGRRVKRELA